MMVAVPAPAELWNISRAVLVIFARSALVASKKFIIPVIDNGGAPAVLASKKLTDPLLVMAAVAGRARVGEIEVVVFVDGGETGRARVREVQAAIVDMGLAVPAAARARERSR